MPLRWVLWVCAGAVLCMAPRAEAVVELRADPIASLTVPRSGHTATALTDGTVLIAGGCARDGCDGQHASAERFDPKTGRFQRTAAMAAPRIGHTATRLADGRVLIAGGWSGDRVTASAELYDPATGRFSPAGAMQHPRAGHTATRLADGRVLMVGGERANQVALAEVEVFDPRRGAFIALGALAEPRIAHRTALLDDGRVLVVGGRAGRGQTLATTEWFDPATGRAAAGPRLAVPRHKFALARLADGRVLVAAGTDGDAPRPRHATTELFDPARNAFVPGPTLPEPRYKIPDALIALPGGEALLAGGGDQALVIDPVRGKVRAVAGALPGAHSFTTVTPLDDGRVLVTGGYDAALALTAGAWVIGAR